MLNREFTLRQSDFDSLRRLIHGRTGIALQDTKYAMVYSRLAKRLRQLGFSDFAQYLALLADKSDTRELVTFINAMTTNQTGFFREGHHFNHLQEQLLSPFIKKAASAAKQDERLRIWSAGCSSGAEPYSIAMTVDAALSESATEVDVKILATDIDTNVLNIGQAGLYSRESLKPVPALMVKNYFRPAARGYMQVSSKLKQAVYFKYLNLMQDWPMKGPFQAIFCRNTLIYFDKKTQKKLIDRYVRLLEPGGILYLGHSESLCGDHPDLVAEGHSVFRKGFDQKQGSGQRRAG